MTGIILPYEQQYHLRFTAEAGELECIDYDEEENTITVNCSTTFQDVVQTVDDSDILENLGNGEYILKANLEVADGITFEMTSSNGDDGNNLQYLKLAGANGIIVYGKILINGVKITLGMSSMTMSLNKLSMVLFLVASSNLLGVKVLKY
jgi:hypothetical protein